MPSSGPSRSPGLKTFLHSLHQHHVDRSIEVLRSLLIRRQIKGSKPCAIATTQLFFRVLSDFKGHQVAKLLERVRSVGLNLISAQPKELVVGIIVRRILGLIREVSAGFETKNSDGNNGTHSSDQAAIQHSPTISRGSPVATRPPLASFGTSFGPTHDAGASLFGIFSDANGADSATPPGTPVEGQPHAPKANRLHSEIKVDVFEGLREILAEINLASEQISEFALSYVNDSDVLLVQGGSGTVHDFLASAAHKRKFTVFCVDGAPNDEAATHGMLLTGKRDGANADAGSDSDDGGDDDGDGRALASRGINVVLVPDAAVHAVMPYVNKVLLAPHAVLANGGLVAAAGAASLAAAAQAHRVPVLVLSAVYQLSPLHPMTPAAELCEVGGAAAAALLAGGAEGAWAGVDVVNPLWDYVEPSKVNLYITNLGGHPPTYLYRIVADHYDDEDIDLGVLDADGIEM